MHPKAKELYRAALQAHEAIYKLVVELTPSAPANTNEANVDLIYALREADKYLDDARKEINRLKTTAESVVCLKWSSVPGGKPIRTDYCTGTPDVKICAHIPDAQKNPEQYARLMTYLGIDPQLWDRGKVLTEFGEEDTEVVKPNYMGLQALVNRLLAHGYKVPDGLEGDTYNKYTVTCRKKKGVLE